MTAVAIITHEEWEDKQNVAFLAPSFLEAELIANQRILDITAPWRDMDEFPEDQDWLDKCLEEGWQIVLSEIEDPIQ